MPGNIPELEDFMDRVIAEPIVEMPPNNSFARIVGIYTKPLRKRKMLSIYKDDKTGDKIARLKVKNLDKCLRRGRIIEYTFELPVIKFPSI